MTSPTDICNKALAWIGTRSTIASLTENSNEAKACARFYDGARQDVLQMFWWGFAKAQIDLTLLGCAEEHTSMRPWRFMYAYPSDCLQARFMILRLGSHGSDGSFGGYPANYDDIANRRPIKFEVATNFDAAGNTIKVINTDTPHAMLCYTRDIQSPDMFDNLFQTALEHLLASYLAIPLTGNTQIAEEHRKIAKDAIDTASAKAGNEGATIQQNLPDWIAVRGVLGFNDPFDYPYWPGGFPL